MFKSAYLQFRISFADFAFKSKLSRLWGVCNIFGFSLFWSADFTMYMSIDSDGSVDSGIELTDIENVNDIIFKETALHAAVKDNNTEKVKLLLADPQIDNNAQNWDGQTPLYMAVQQRRLDIINLITNTEDVNVNLPDVHGKTPLIACAFLYNILDVLSILLSHDNINVNLKDKSGNTALHSAALNNNLEVLTFLLERADADIDVQNKQVQSIVLKSRNINDLWS